MSQLSTATPPNHAATQPIEAANEKLVNDFCAAWSRLDLSAIESALADDITFQLIDGFPLVEGREAFMAQVKGFLANVERCEFEMFRSEAIGNLVINERFDHFYAKEGEKDQHFHVSGSFLVKDGKIKVWKDYWLPGDVPDQT